MKANRSWPTVTALTRDLRNWLQLLARDGETVKAQPQRHAKAPPAITRNKQGEPTARSCTHDR
ncbi:hypothetical protein ABT187_28685 [Streptomyces sp. NPDC001817]|uniref:hypothetical protein n=1 Tax=Streptomyces sp. NPDC001817 TaxID=3154398 RepID=UPI00332BF9F0